MNDLKLGNYPGVKVLDESGPIMSGGITPDATSAHEFARLVYQFYKETFDRDSYDDDDGVGPNGGGKLVSYVRRDHMKNAAWKPRRKAMVYGPGYAKALDIAAHEFTHAVIQHSANLIYANEPGALNESFADIFGVLIEASYESEDWSLGENLPQYAPPNPPLRSMGDPHTGGFKRDQAFSDDNRGQPDHYSEYVRSTHRICKTTTDKFNGCVHFNSGIFNKAAYLIAKGGRHHRETVAGIGRAKLAEIMYRTLLTKLGSSSAMAAAADSVIESCDELAVAGQFGITDSDCNEVTGAFRAVGLR